MNTIFLVYILISFCFIKCHSQSNNFIKFDELVVEIIDDVVNKNVLHNKLDQNCLDQLKVLNSSIINNENWAQLGKIKIL